MPKNNSVYLGNQMLMKKSQKTSGGFVMVGDEKFYKIHNYHLMPDFFLSIISDSDHWMFLSSNGSLTAGRKNRDNALFPYYTDDKIHDYKGITGSRSIFLVDKEERTFLWEPFSDESEKTYDITRNLFKNITGNKIIFEEVNSDLDLVFSYSWSFSNRFGFVKKSNLKNKSESTLRIQLLDGITNILPSGVDYAFQNEYSNLLDAYKKSERVEETTLGLYFLSSIPVDKAEPSEALKATTVWSCGLSSHAKILLSGQQVDNFRRGKDIDSELDKRAARGAYFVQTSMVLAPVGDRSWFIIAGINQDTTQVSNLKHLLQTSKDLISLLKYEINQSTLNIKKLVAAADGLQVTNTGMCFARHYMNTLYNIMRGGVFVQGYDIQVADYSSFVHQSNMLLSKELHSWIENLPEIISHKTLLDLAKNANDADLLRITYEYLPLTFSRRHGDPSRPWNLFSIETTDATGNTKFSYQGNWRDIFQNWEALGYAFPEYISGFISKFANASTIDGYNPYRITREGFDWETPDPEDPWSYIGYWGDHQIIYLQKFLELSEKFYPGKLDTLLTEEIFVYANVPYRIKNYDDILRNPHDTVVFDYDLDKRLKSERDHLGADAFLVKASNSHEVYKVNLTEKILVSLLSKLSNFVPEAGIWMNTQRPEWNDANNALVGNGASMVTLFYLRRSLMFWYLKWKKTSTSHFALSEEVADLLENINTFFAIHQSLISTGFSNADRKTFADFLGQAHNRFRNGVYEFAFSGEKKLVDSVYLAAFAQLSLQYLNQSIRSNKRSDGLFHAYNLISIKPQEVTISRLYEMLEGQVAVLSSGYLTANESLCVVDALKRSKMFNPGQYSYMLYPDRQLKRFLEKNNVPDNLVTSSRLLTQLVADEELSIIKKDNEGLFHFNGNFRNAADLEAALDKLRMTGYSNLVASEKEMILEIFEQVFEHQFFTGRSGTFYGYEGLGSIYWHMVSKLLLAVQENYFLALETPTDTETIHRLKQHYYEIKAGIGLYKSPEIYGAFPMDAYSHTPGNSGVKQPGLTGQVKEDIISRLGELGIRIVDGAIIFLHALINEEEILNKKTEFEYFTTENQHRLMPLQEGQLAYTFCQIPIIYTFNKPEQITIYFRKRGEMIIPGNRIDKEISSQIFARNAEIQKIEVHLNMKDYIFAITEQSNNSLSDNYPLTK